jgi:hypothetical protein
MNLKEMWKEYLEIWNEGRKLWFEYDKLFREANKLWSKRCFSPENYELYNEYTKLSVESNKIQNEADKFFNEANKIFWDFVYENYGKEVYCTSKYGDIVLTNGVILYYDGRVYEPLEVVMKKIIKEHEENKDEG